MSKQQRPRELADNRLLANKTPLTGALAKVAALQGYEFDCAPMLGMKPTLQGVGLVADEVQAQLPAAVSVEGPQALKHYSQGALIALLVEAIKELQGLIPPPIAKVAPAQAVAPAAPVTEEPL